MKALALVALVGVVVITLIADLGYGSRAFSFLRLVPGRDLTGHFVLFGFVGFATQAWVARWNPPPTRFARVCALAAVSLLVALEEASQALIPTRTFSLDDLAASLAGLLVGAVIAVWLVRPRPAGDAA